mmetsp:Transcript_52382/g.131644  ORF Transcript_52382/g.131644 Transcript_52382/m.131644 type:complete len:235 (-) Transcript_52382:277-981(-)
MKKGVCVCTCENKNNSTVHRKLFARVTVQHSQCVLWLVEVDFWQRAAPTAGWRRTAEHRHQHLQHQSKCRSLILSKKTAQLSHHPYSELHPVRHHSCPAPHKKDVLLWHIFLPGPILSSAKVCFLCQEEHRRPRKLKGNNPNGTGVQFGHRHQMKLEFELQRQVVRVQEHDDKPLHQEGWGIHRDGVLYGCLGGPGASSGWEHRVKRSRYSCPPFPSRMQTLCTNLSRRSTKNI